MGSNLLGSLCPWEFPGKNTGVGCHFLLQGLFLTQGLNPGLQHCMQRLYHLSHQGNQDLVETHEKLLSRENLLSVYLHSLYSLSCSFVQVPIMFLLFLRLTGHVP